MAKFVTQHALYNRDCAVIELMAITPEGRKSGGIAVKISNVFEDQRGRKAMAGQNMYDYENGRMFVLNLEEAIVIQAKIEEIFGGSEIFVASHRRNETLQVFSLGFGIDGERKDLLQACIETYHRDDDPATDEPRDVAFWWIDMDETLDSVRIDDRPVDEDLKLTVISQVFNTWIERATAIALGVPEDTRQGGRGGRDGGFSDSYAPPRRQSRRAPRDEGYPDGGYEEADDIRYDDQPPPPQTGGRRPPPPLRVPGNRRGGRPRPASRRDTDDGGDSIPFDDGQ